MPLFSAATYVKRSSLNVSLKMHCDFVVGRSLAFMDSISLCRSNRKLLLIN